MVSQLASNVRLRLAMSTRSRRSRFAVGVVDRLVAQDPDLRVDDAAARSAHGDHRSLEEREHPP